MLYARMISKLCSQRVIYYDPHTRLFLFVGGCFSLCCTGQAGSKGEHRHEGSVRYAALLIWADGHNRLEFSLIKVLYLVDYNRLLSCTVCE